MQVKRGVTGVAAAAVLLLAGCSGGSTADEPAASSAPPEPTPSVTTEAATPSASPSGSGSSRPVKECLTASYTLARFVSVGGKKTYGTGQGGDVRLVFRSDSYTMTGAAAKPITVTLAGQNAELYVDGTVTGGYTAKADDTVDFTLTRTSGKAALEAAGQRRELQMGDVAKVLAPEGSAKAACTETTLVLTLADTRLEFEKA